MVAVDSALECVGTGPRRCGDRGETLGVLRFVAGRAAQALLVAFVVATLAFVLIHVAPGDPFALAPGDPPELAIPRNAMRHAYGLDRPLLLQYPATIGNMVRGDFGMSYQLARPVSEVLRRVLPVTFLLMAPALVLGVLLGVAIGTWQGARHGRLVDRAVSAASLTILSIPEFLLALIVSTVFALGLRWFPATGVRDAGTPTGVPLLATLGDVAWHGALPLATLVTVIAAVVARYQRSAVAVALDEDFVRAARARGAPPRRVLFRHVLRRTLATQFTVVGLLAPVVVSGQSLVEMIFNWPGAGMTLLQAVQGRDYPLVIALVLVGSVGVSIASALADIGAAWANPAVRADS